VDWTFQVGCYEYFDRFYLPIPDEETVWQVYPEPYIPGYFVCNEHHGAAVVRGSLNGILTAAVAELRS
jgi:hypothetical protein